MLKQIKKFFSKPVHYCKACHASFPEDDLDFLYPGNREGTFWVANCPCCSLSVDGVSDENATPQQLKASALAAWLAIDQEYVDQKNLEAKAWCINWDLESDQLSLIVDTLETELSPEIELTIQVLNGQTRIELYDTNQHIPIDLPESDASLAQKLVDAYNVAQRWVGKNT